MFCNSKFREKLNSNGSWTEMPISQNDFSVCFVIEIFREKLNPDSSWIENMPYLCFYLWFNIQKETNQHYS